MRKVKVGHAGTLDPLATGVLVVCLGAATRLIEYVQRMPKTYRTVIRLGASSDSHDADGLIVEREGVTAPAFEQVREAVAAQVGSILQKPPEFSALKVSGRRAHDLARAGVPVDLAPRPVTIHRIEILSYDWPRLELEVFCEGGTYIRSIARDVGESLATGGLVEVLTRTAIGPFVLTEAVDPDQITAESLGDLLRPPEEALASMPQFQANAEEAADLARGRPFRIRGEGVIEGELAVFNARGRLLAIARVDPTAGLIAPKRVLGGE